jgi:glycosyltransferase involved in cell wall biosynthesis
VNRKILSLFFTRGISLKIWVETGLFEREKSIYERHLELGTLQKVYFFTYGTSDTEVYEKLKQQGRIHESIKVFQMPIFFNIWLGSWLYSFALPFVHRKALKKSHILKTNQMDGSWSAVIAKFLYNKKLIVRTGFTQSIFFKKSNKNKLIILLSSVVERFSYIFCNIGVVASYQDQEYILNKYNPNKAQVKVIHNYIDTKLFRDNRVAKFKNRIICIGRLSHQKNLFNLIDAINQFDLILDVYGNGKLRVELESYALEKNARVNFKGIVKNDCLPDILNKYKYYVISSFYEGMPKSLLEAMSCSLICVGANVRGVNEVITDKINGFLAKDTSVECLSDSISEAINYDQIDMISQNARLLIEREFSLNMAAQREKKIFDELI